MTITSTSHLKTPLPNPHTDTLLDITTILESQKARDACNEPSTHIPHIGLVDGGETEAEIAPAVLLGNLFGRGENPPRGDEDAVLFFREVDPERVAQVVGPGFLVERMGGEVEFEPEEHAAERPDEIVHQRLFHHAPLRRHAVAAARFDQVTAFFEDGAHGLHPALVVASETFEPAHPTGNLPPATVLGAATATVARAVRSHDELCDHGLHEA